MQALLNFFFHLPFPLLFLLGVALFFTSLPFFVRLFFLHVLPFAFLFLSLFSFTRSAARYKLQIYLAIYKLMRRKTQILRMKGSTMSKLPKVAIQNPNVYAKEESKLNASFLFFLFSFTCYCLFPISFPSNDHTFSHIWMVNLTASFFSHRKQQQHVFFFFNTKK